MLPDHPAQTSRSRLRGCLRGSADGSRRTRHHPMSWVLAARRRSSATTSIATTSRQPDRRARGDLSGGAADHGRGLLSRHGPFAHPRHAADIAPAVRVRPRLPGFHRRLRIRAGHALARRHGEDREGLARRLSRGRCAAAVPRTRSRPCHRTRLGDLVFAAHPATRIVRSPYPAVAIFAMNRVEGPVAPLESSAAEDALVTRPEMEVTVRLLPPGGAAFLTSLIGGETLGCGCRSALSQKRLRSISRAASRA